MGVHYIADMRFVTGNIDNALREVDDLLFRIIHSEWLGDKRKQERISCGCYSITLTDCGPQVTRLRRC